MIIGNRRARHGAYARRMKHQGTFAYNALALRSIRSSDAQHARMRA